MDSDMRENSKKVTTGCRQPCDILHHWSGKGYLSSYKLSPIQIAFVIILWIVLVTYILLYSEINGMTVLSILMSGAIVFIPIYKNLKK
jgi:hypothetical protein